MRARLLFLIGCSLLPLACGGALEGEPSQDSLEPLPATATLPASCVSGTTPIGLPAHPFALPSHTLSCSVVSGVDETTTTVWRYDPDTQTLGAGTFQAAVLFDGLYWTYNEAGRVIRYGQRSGGQPGFEQTIDYDAGGELARLYMPGSADERYENHYDAERRLIQSDLVMSSYGFAPLSEFFAYDADGRLATDELDRGGDGAIEQRITYTYRDGCSLERTEQVGSWHGFADGAVIVRKLAFYDDAGRLERIESDGGGYFDTPADGNADEIDRYRYDKLGYLVEFERDGTADDTGGPADGTPDERLRFSSDCSELYALRRDIFRFPN